MLPATYEQHCKGCHPLTFDPDASVVAKPDREAAYQLFKDLEFALFARDMAPEATTFSFSHRVAPDAAGLDGLIAAARTAGEAAFSLSITSDRPMDAQVQGIASLARMTRLPRSRGGLPGNVRGLLGIEGREVDDLFAARFRRPGKPESGWAAGSSTPRSPPMFFHRADAARV
jgi:hypothetical protein